MYQGFNSFELNQNMVLITILEGDNDEYTYLFRKVSLIARNGFVETWYDQSGNGFTKNSGYTTIYCSNGGQGGVYSPSVLFQSNI